MRCVRGEIGKRGVGVCGEELRAGLGEGEVGRGGAGERLGPCGVGEFGDGGAVDVGEVGEGEGGIGEVVEEGVGVGA